MIRVVIDTNVIVSAIIARKPSPPLYIWKALLAQNIVLVTSVEILAEVEEVLNRDSLVKLHGRSSEDIRNLLAQVAKLSVIVPLLSIPTVCRDPNDDVFLACAISGSADYIISGDKDLLELKNYEGIEILSPGNFVEDKLSSQ